MSKIYFNFPYEGGKIEKSNGATRRNLVIVSGKDFQGEFIPYNDKGWTQTEGEVAYYEKGNHSYIFINPPKKEGVVGVFMGGGYGVNVSPEPIFMASSCGGYGNSESNIGIVTCESILAHDTYKGRHGVRYDKFTPDGFIPLGNDVLLDGEEAVEV